MTQYKDGKWVCVCGESDWGTKVYGETCVEIDEVGNWSPTGEEFDLNNSVESDPFCWKCRARFSLPHDLAT